MPDETKRRQLKIEPDFSGEDALEQLLASLRRIEAGLSNIADVVIRIDERTKAVSGGSR